MMTHPRTPRTSQVRVKQRRERGAAVFVVMMAILLLSGMGMWAMHSAGLVDRASGYERAALQTQYVSETGLLAAVSYLSLPHLVSTNYRLGQLAAGGDTCESIPTGVPTSPRPFCRALWVRDLKQPLISTTSLVDMAASGSLSVDGELQADITVEMTSPRKAIVPGAPLGSTSPYRMVTLTSYGTVRPPSSSFDPNAGNLCTANASAENAAAGRIAVRGHAIIGPIQ